MAGEERYVLSVLVADRVGVLRGITAAVTDLGARIEAISQTVVRGYFTVILTAAFPAGTTAESVDRAVRGQFRQGEISTIVRPYEPELVAGQKARGERYVLTMWGPQQGGVLKLLTAFLAEKGVNVEDLFVEFREPDAVFIGELTVPAVLDIQQLHDELQQAVAPRGMTATVQHENLFRATNEITSIRPLLRTRRHA